MKTDDNHISDEHLSRFLDDEISPERRKTVEEHLSLCAFCSDRLNRFKGLREVAAESPVPVPERDLWMSIDRRIESPEVSSRYDTTWVAKAAAVLLVLFMGAWLFLGEPFDRITTGNEPAETANQFAFDYGLYLSGLQNPEMMERFVTGYRQQRVAPEITVNQADMNFMRSLPSGLSVESVYLLESACCQGKQFTLEHEGQQITLFQQPRQHPAEFTGYHVMHTVIDSADCSKVEADRHFALTYDSEELTYVVVGSREDPMVTAIVSGLASIY